MSDDVSQGTTISGKTIEGLEIGAVSVKWLQGKDGEGFYYLRVRHNGNPRKALQDIIDGQSDDDLPRVVVTGQSARVLLGLPYRSETECIELALKKLDQKPDILLSLGGETFTVYTLKDGIVKDIISSSKCAAGTGEFLVQQFQRMGLSLTEGVKASREGKFVKLATRCSVHCKSDATHKLNKGECSPGDIAKSLVRDLAKKVSKMTKMARWPTDTIVVSGGLVVNEPFIDNLRTELPDSKIDILPESPYLEAFGAFLFASEFSDDIDIVPRREWINSSSVKFPVLKPLSDAEDLLDYQVMTGGTDQIIKGDSYILGVDAGSTTTKAVLFNVKDGAVGARCYLRTLGNPVLATKNCLNELIKQVDGKSIKIIQVGVTGSGREMVSVYMDNCLSFNEILAHARAASEYMPDVDTVFEIGGQDSKFISFLDGIPIDYAMNEGCSAGTGSFLEESTSVDMGIDVKEISGIAEKSSNPLAFGERCAAFINTDLRNALQQGAPQDDVVAGLVYSIADNYISRIVGDRNIGEKILFLGGVALNKSAGLAIAARSQSKIVVPPYPEMMGSIGTALMARDLMDNSDIEAQDYKLEEMLQSDISIKGTFLCKACENYCEIQRISIHEKSYPFGGLCSRWERARHEGEDAEVCEGRDLVAERNSLMFNDFGIEPAESPRGKIGLPMALVTYELFPLFSKLITELGYKVVLSKPSRDGNNMATSSICYPGEIAHGAVHELEQRGVDYILLPGVLDLSCDEGYLHGYACPTTASIPDIIRATFNPIADKILGPTISLDPDYAELTLKEIERIGKILGIKKKQARQAGEKALDHYQEYRTSLDSMGLKVLEELKDEPTVIIAGRPYTTCSPEVNLSLPRKIISRGYNVISADLLPQMNRIIHPRNVWKFTQQIMNAVSYAKQFPNMHICLLSCFSCGPDSVIYHVVRQELAGQTFCYLEIDSHTAHAGFETRIGAFLDIIEGRERKLKSNVRYESRAGN